MLYSKIISQWNIFHSTKLKRWEVAVIHCTVKDNRNQKQNSLILSVNTQIQQHLFSPSIKSVSFVYTVNHRVRGCPSLACVNSKNLNMSPTKILLSQNFHSFLPASPKKSSCSFLFPHRHSTHSLNFRTQGMQCHLQHNRKHWFQKTSTPPRPYISPQITRACKKSGSSILNLKN